MAFKKIRNALRSSSNAQKYSFENVLSLSRSMSCSYCLVVIRKGSKGYLLLWEEFPL